MLVNEAILTQLVNEVPHKQTGSVRHPLIICHVLYLLEDTVGSSSAVAEPHASLTSTASHLLANTTLPLFSLTQN